MVAAARPGPSDARVPCPLCGGLIHPIAGKCKHCKADLATYHAPRASAAAPLPSLRGGLAPPPPASPSGQVHWIGKPQAAVEPASSPVRPEPLPVLPPQPTARAAAEPQTSTWRSWPVIVIGLAVIAIIAAVVLMVLPSSHDEDRGKRATASSPAPDRMQTSPNITPLPPSPAPHATPTPVPTPVPTPAPAPDQDPWADPDANAVPHGNPAPTPAPVQPDDDLDNADPLVQPHAQVTPPSPGNRRRLNLNPNGSMMMTMAAHLCHKMAQCGASDASTLQICNTLAAQAPPLPAHCPAAARCVKAIDSMSCASQSGDLSQIPTLFTQFVDCGAAAQC